MEWLARIPRALAVLLGLDDAEKLSRSLTIERDLALTDLALCKKGRESDSISIREARRERDEWKAKALAALPPGERLNAGLDAARGVLSHVRPVPPVAGVPDGVPAGSPTGKGDKR